ncbi:hypothetical protein [Streptomyces spiralis]|uniref:hypothetical protein n=1 Tax=Streptomyces spiralis TaxID=66376 RepID=UPI0036A03F54
MNEVLGKEAPRTHDVSVIETGPVGQRVAERARGAGLNTAIGERELLGGDCSF